MIRAALVLVVVLLPATALAAPAPDVPPTATAAAKPKCLGKTATIVGSKRADRRLVGTRRADVIVGRGGNDRIDGKGGNDRICGGAGNDRIDGGKGKDRCDGGKGKNRIRGCENKKKAAPANVAPVAAADAATTGEDASVAIPVLANDRDADGDALAILSVQPGAAKAAVSFGDGKVVYDPRGKLDALPAGQTLTETIAYTVSDGVNPPVAGAVVVTVTGVDDLPVAVADTASVDQDTAATPIDVLANDTDVDGGPKAIASVDDFTSHGTVTITGAGVTYQPDPGFCGLDDTFRYTLNGGAVGTVTVTVACVGTPPTAVDDTGGVSEDSEPTSLDVLENDTDPDSPTITIVSATQPANGTVVVLPGGTGLTYRPHPNFCTVGTSRDAFTYTLSGGSTATVRMQVTCVDDAPAPIDDSATVLEDAAATAVPVLANDTDVDGGIKAISAASDPPHGTVALTGGSAGSHTGLTYKPDANFCGSDSFTYTIKNGVAATVNVTVTCVNDAPVADDESFLAGNGAIGNTPLVVGTTRAEPRKAVSDAQLNLLIGDTDVDTATASLSTVAGTIQTAKGGTVTMEADGQFIYFPAAGFVGQDTFSYTVTDGQATDTGLVTIDVIDRVWYVDSTKAQNGSGTAASPMNTLDGLDNSPADADGTGDTIFLHGTGTYGGGLTLESSQVLRSQRAGLSSGQHTIVTAAGSENPVIENTGGNALTLGTSNVVQGVNLGTASGASLAGSGFGSAVIGSTHIGTINNPSGKAIDLDNGNATMTFTSVTSTGSATNAIRLNNVTGSVIAGTGTLSNATGAVVLINQGTGSFSYAGTITDDTGRLVEITSKSGGTHTFSGPITDGNDGDGDGIFLSGNAAAARTDFTGGLTLSTGASRAFDATGGGTINVTGAANTLATTSAHALRAVNTQVGSSGLTFRSIRSVGGTSTGIMLENTGANNALTVTGDGATAGSGGTISDKTGADNDSSTGTGIALLNVTGVSLSRMQLDDHQNHAIRGTNVTGFKLLDSVVNGVNGTNAAIDEAAVAFTDLKGTGVEIARSTISGGVEDNLQVHNSSGTLDRLTVSSSTIGHNGTAEGNDGIGILASGTAVVNATIQNSTFQGARGDMVDHNVGGSSASNLQLLNNTLHNTHPNIVGGGGGITVSSSGTGDLTYDIDTNSFRGSKGSAIVVCKCFGGTPGDATAVGRIENNTIGVAGGTGVNVGSSEGSGIAVTQLARGRHSSVIQNNTIRRYANHGILMTVGGAAESVTGLSHDGQANFTVVGNTIAEPLAPAGGLAQNGIHLNAGTNTGDDYNVCLDLGSPTRNTLTGSGALAGGTDYRLRQRFEVDVRMPGYTSTVTNDPNQDGTLDNALISYLTPRTNGGFTLSSQSSTTGGFLNTVNSAPCATT